MRGGAPTAAWFRPPLQERLSRFRSSNDGNGGLRNPEIWAALGTASVASPTLGGAPSDRGGHLHLGLMLGQLRVEK